MQLKTNASGNTTTYTYDTLNQMHLDRANLLSLTDAKGNKTTYTYDALDRLTKVNDVLGQTYQFFYDQQGNLTTKKDPKGKSTYYKYIPSDKLQRIIYPNFSLTHYTFDLAENIIRIKDSSGLRQCSYDKLNRLTKIVYPDGVSLEYSYDENGNRSTLEVSGWGKVAYEYDQLNRLVKITLPDKRTVQFAYNSLTQRTQTIYPNGAVTTYTYDKAGRLRQLVNKDKQTRILSQFSYTYDANSRRTRIDLLDGFINYTYDSLGQLIKEEGVIKGKPFSVSYTYDQVGNRLSSQEDGALLKYTYNSLHQLLKLTPQEDSPPTTYTYDKNGNLIQRDLCQNTEIFTYDYQDQLKAYQGPVFNATYTYNSQGQRISKTLDDLTTQYYYDGPELILEKTPDQVIYYIYGPGLDELIADSRGYCYHSDGLGSVANITDKQSGYLGHYLYSSFGSLRQKLVGIDQPHLFTSRPLDTESGLYYHRNRYYDPGIGRFITPDPSLINRRFSRFQRGQRPASSWWFAGVVDGVHMHRGCLCAVSVLGAQSFGFCLPALRACWVSGIL